MWYQGKNYQIFHWMTKNKHCINNYFYISDHDWLPKVTKIYGVQLYIFYPFRVTYITWFSTCGTFQIDLDLNHVRMIFWPLVIHHIMSTDYLWSLRCEVEKKVLYFCNFKLTNITESDINPKLLTNYLKKRWVIPW